MLRGHRRTAELPQLMPLLATMLKLNDYRAVMLGKWRLDFAEDAGRATTYSTATVVPSHDNFSLGRYPNTAYIASYRIAMLICRRTPALSDVLRNAS